MKNALLHRCTGINVNSAANDLYGQSMQDLAPRMKPFVVQVLVYGGLGLGYSYLRTFRGIRVLHAAAMGYRVNVALTPYLNPSHGTKSIFVHHNHALCRIGVEIYEVFMIIRILNLLPLHITVVLGHYLHTTTSQHITHGNNIMQVFTKHTTSIIK